MNAPMPVPSLDNAKLQKIVRVLIDRVERDMDSQGSAFGLFQTAIVLEHKVRERTGELYGAVSGYAGRPTRSQLEEIDAVVGQLQKSQDNVQSVLGSLDNLNSRLTTAKLDPIRLTTKEEFLKKP